MGGFEALHNPAETVPGGPLVGRISSELRLGRLTLYFLVWLLCLAKVGYFTAKISPGVMPDEIAHVSYAAYLTESGRLIPDFGEMYILAEDDGWSATKNYLAHPPLYYHIIAAFLPDDSGSASRDALILRGRQPARLIGIAAITLMLWIGLRLEMPLLLHLVYATGVASAPMLCFVAAGVNNDGIAVLGGAMTVLGLCRLAEQRGVSSSVLVGLGVCLAGLAKLTAALLCGGLTAVYLGWILIKGRRNPRTDVISLAVIVTLALPAVAYHGVQIARYGTLIPSPQAVEGSSPPVNTGDRPTAVPDRASFVGWSAHFARLMGASWVNISAHRFIDRDSPLAVAGLVALPLLAFLGLLRRGDRHSRHLETIRVVLKGAALACAAVLAVHFVFTYRRFLATGEVRGVQARYYFPLLAPLLLLAASTLERLHARWWIDFAVFLLVAQLLYSDFYYFLMAATTSTW